MKRSNCPDIEIKNSSAICRSVFIDSLCFPAVYRQGDIGTSWYAVLSGSLDVKVSETANHQVRETTIRFI